MIFCFSKNNTILTALDITLNKDVKKHEHYLEQAKNITIRESIDTMLPEIARCL